MKIKDTINLLQKQAAEFLQNYYMQVNNVDVYPKVIEVYYFAEGQFEDNSVHKNELQKNNRCHFYVHRNGIKKTDSYKAGMRGGLDFVISDNDNYYAYLIRSAVIDNKPIFGPHNVMKEICNACKLTKNALEDVKVKLVPQKCRYDIFFSSRINLGKNVDEVYFNSELRAVICDEWYIKGKYKYKEKMLQDFVFDKVNKNLMTKKQALDYSKDHLGYIPSILKT